MICAKARQVRLGRFECEQLEGQIERSAQSHVAVVHERVEVPEMPVMGMQTNGEKRVHSSGLSLEVEGILARTRHGWLRAWRGTCG